MDMPWFERFGRLCDVSEATMIVLNFSHPLTSAHLEQIEAFTGKAVGSVLDVATDFNNSKPFAAQVRKLVDSIGFTPREWQTIPLLVNPPSLNSITVVLVAELHGRMGYFPTVLRLRPVANITPPQFEVAEIIDLQAIRDTARERRR